MAKRNPCPTCGARGTLPEQEQLLAEAPPSSDPTHPPLNDKPCPTCAGACYLDDNGNPIGREDDDDGSK